MKKKKGNGTKSILKFAGAFDKSDLSRMKIAIEEGCENVEEDFGSQ